MPRNKIIDFSLTGASLLIGILIAELIVRVFLPQPLIVLRPDIWVPNSPLGWQLKANIDTRVNLGEREVRLIVDEHGHRVGSLFKKKSEGDYLILTLGDSFLEALQVDYEQTFTAILEKKLTNYFHRRFSIINTGVAGWGPSHCLIKMRQELKKSKYNLVIVFLYKGNDIEKNWTKEFSPRKSIEKKLRVPKNFKKAEWNVSFFYPINNFFETKSHLFILLKNRFKYLLMRLGLTAYSFPEVFLRSEMASTRWAASAQICGLMKKEAKDHNVPIYFVLIPSLVDVNEEIAHRYMKALDIEPSKVDFDQPSRLLASELKARGIELIDMTTQFRTANISGIRDLFGRIDTHLGLNGHKLVADILFSFISSSVGGHSWK